ncbi:MAG: AbrB/MazE/SpoVT family DNA-binding domain-containing protein [Ruminococcus sp.]|nr:AbrB/MazE/SpoVT family DNA-binding domain-containing protein [Ruminococcus sp.]MBQ1433068.1 AbrB/MazE/SpoVT family DNA-binding domain-containing protein [Ruminococcus sp.]
MKSTGIVRQVDNLGRIVLPIEIRRSYDLAVKDNIEIYTEDDKIILKKCQRSCIFCKATENLIDYKGKSICAECAADIKGTK